MNNTHPIERFLKKIQFNQQTNCWEWIGAKGANGYGNMTIHGKQITPHRFSFKVFKGPVRSKLVLHKCDNRLCVNPDHLYIGTYQDNSRDESIRGNHKLSNENVKQIRALRDEGKTQVELASLFNVSRRYVRNILLGKLRRYVA